MIRIVCLLLVDLPGNSEKKTDAGWTKDEQHHVVWRKLIRKTDVT